MSGQRFPMILAIADRPGWAIDSKARNLRRILAGRFDLVVRYQHEVTEPELRVDPREQFRAGAATWNGCLDGTSETMTKRPASS